jgi:hypothetical protein
MASKAQFVVVYRTAGQGYKWAAYDQKKRIREGVHRSYKKALTAARNMLRGSPKRRKKK